MSGTISENKQVARRIYEEMWNRRDPGYAVEIFERPQGVETFVREFLVSFPDLVHTVEDMIAEQDRVAVRFTARGTHLGEWSGFPATGKAIQYSGVTWLRIADGKIAEHQTLWDQTDLIQQIGG